jgi:DNA-binding GntR family transcriptional regulator
VARPTPQEARDVFRARAVIEDETVRQAAVKAGPAQIAELRDLIGREHRAVDDGDRRQQIRLSGAFHIKIAEICGNGVLTDLLHALVSRTSLIIALYETPGNSACISDDHGGLIEAIAAADTGLAAERMRCHLEDCERRLRLADDQGSVDLAEVFRDFTASGEPA